ncbi:MAG: type II secretion system F family protein [Candidatus Liberibacter asiaticus]|nr:type II secretion system F family protein [Candidatus Liberibacter asiaticus]AGH16842.1 pilus assembly protein [Candidatus Liberibacter asiaticus str. gxpsy]BAP26363.1 pilus assembly protein [Candidatus Liberibacter asiaticus str. Ishi-1]KAE9510192.1 Bacterial type II secretion system protein F domain protein [Candidatus Liberibacter asiaticus]KAE9510968.1 Bacterial type II secretion system protein F domain protein [Candidatus Liberibacter asiaticus]KAE9512322.1 Bacterial type II secretion 
MFDVNSWFLVGLITVSVFCFLYAIFYNVINPGDSKSQDNAKVVRADRVIPTANTKRRKELREAIQKIELNHKAKIGNTKSIDSLISCSGLPISKQHYYIGSCVIGFICGVLSLTLSSSFFTFLCVSVSSALVFPRFFLKHLIKKRTAKFLDDFPNALDIIVRSVRAGLPVSDAVAVIVGQSSDPVRSEFRRVIETQHLGLSLSESISRMVRYMPLQEVSFFSTVISVQSQLGGNLSEALANLSRILRDRKNMKAKVQALSMEAKASAWIIGSLPFCVSTLVYFTSPGYMNVLINDPRGHMLLGVAAAFMLIGIMVMRLMINFDV